MSPGTYGAVQVFQSSTINTPPSMPVVQPDSQKKDPQKNGVSSKCPLIAAYISGAQFSALVYHNSTVTNVPTQDRNQETNIQMVVKLSSKLHLPVLQAGLFSVVSKIGDTVDAVTPDPVDPLSLLDFSLRLPEHNTQCQHVEAGLRDTLAMLTAKIVQSEWSTNPVLLWHQLTTCRRPSTYAQPKPSQGKLSPTQ